MTWTADENLVARFETYSGEEQTLTLVKGELFSE